MKRLSFTLSLLLAACGSQTPPPPIAAGMDVSIDNAEWPVRLTKRFPAGTQEPEVVSTFEAQGFAVDREARTAKASWAGGFCNHDVDAVWTVGDDDRITSIEGRYFPTCP